VILNFLIAASLLENYIITVGSAIQRSAQVSADVLIVHIKAVYQPSQLILGKCKKLQSFAGCPNYRHAQKLIEILGGSFESLDCENGQLLKFTIKIGDEKESSLIDRVNKNETGAKIDLD